MTPTDKDLERIAQELYSEIQWGFNCELWQWQEKHGKLSLNEFVERVLQSLHAPLVERIRILEEAVKEGIGTWCCSCATGASGTDGCIRCKLSKALNEGKERQ